MSDIWNTLKALVTGTDRDAQASVRGRGTQQLDALDARERRTASPGRNTPAADSSRSLNPVEREARDTIAQRNASRARHRVERRDAESSAARSLRIAQDAQLDRHAGEYDNRSTIDHEGVPDSLRSYEFDTPYRSTAHQMLAELQGDYGRMGDSGDERRPRMGLDDTNSRGREGTDQAIRDLYNFQFRVAPALDREGPDPSVRDATRRLNAARHEINESEHRSPGALGSVGDSMNRSVHQEDYTDRDNLVNALLHQETSHYPEQSVSRGRIRTPEDARNYVNATRALQENQEGPVSRPTGKAHYDTRGADDESELRRRALRAMEFGDYSVST